jgi:hypothetical protein
VPIKNGSCYFKDFLELCPMAYDIEVIDRNQEERMIIEDYFPYCFTGLHSFAMLLCSKLF